MNLSFTTKFADQMLGALAGGALILPAAAGAQCPAANRFVLNISALPTETLDYASRYSFVAENGLGQRQPINISFLTSNLASTIIAGVQMPAITSLINDGGGINNLVLGGIFSNRTPNVSINDTVVVAVIELATPVRDVTMQINDVDSSFDRFRDWVELVGGNGSAAYVPALMTPFGTNNGTAGPNSDPRSSQTIGPATIPVTISASQTVGTSASGNNAATGTITAQFAEPVRRIELRYGNYPLQSGESATAQQGVGIQTISFCPMPDISINKASASFATQDSDPTRFNVPGSDIIYSITVTNTNSSAVDANQLVLTDPLPPELTFYNGDIDDAGPLSTNFEFLPGTSSLTLAPTDVTYSNNGGANFGAAPAAGYDPAINALRINPQGALAPDSSFTVRFRARIK